MRFFKRRKDKKYLVNSCHQLSEISSQLATIKSVFLGHLVSLMNFSLSAFEFLLLDFYFNNMQALYPFNVRVYGLLVNEHNEILISDEQEYGRRFSKFPGGGLEYGEGLRDALKREYMEECAVEIEVLEHIYTTDFYERSHFNDSQILSVYYRVTNLVSFNLSFKTNPFEFDDLDGEVLQTFRWLSLDKIKVNDLTFKTDQIALNELLQKNV